MQRTTETTLLTIIAALWLIGVAALGDTIVIGIILTLPGLCALALAARQARAGRYESVAPWACCALVLLAFLGILSLANVHLHEFTGARPGWNCDAMAQSCEPQPLQGLVHVLSLLSFVAAGVVILRLISYSSHRIDHGEMETSARS